MQSAISPLANKIKQYYSKENIYSNSRLIYSLNKNLEFPVSLVYSQFSQSPQQIMQALKELDTIKIINKQKIKLTYPGSNRIVLIKGIKKEILEDKIKQFNSLGRVKVKKYHISNGSGTFEMENEEGAFSLKKFIRYTKKTFDINQNSTYKIDISTKIRIIIEGQELYTFLLDHQFEKEHRLFIMQQENLDDTYTYQPIIGYQNTMDYSKREDSQDQISDITSKCSQAHSSKIMKQLIETNQTGTQINEAIASEAVKKNEMTPQLKQQDIFGEEETTQFSYGKKSQEMANFEKGPIYNHKETIQTKSQHLLNAQFEDSIREKTNSIIVPPFNFEAEKFQPNKTNPPSSISQIYSYQTIVNLYQNLIDKDLLPQPQILNQHPNVLAKNESHEKFLDSIYKKVTKQKSNNSLFI